MLLSMKLGRQTTTLRTNRETVCPAPALALHLFYRHPHPLLHAVDVVVVDHEVAAEVLDLPPGLGDDGGLVGVDQDARHTLAPPERSVVADLIQYLELIFKYFFKLDIFSCCEPCFVGVTS